MTAPQEMTREQIESWAYSFARSGHSDENKAELKLLCDMAEAYRASLSADRVSGWVKCSERLPESGDVLVVWENGSVEYMDSSSVESYTHRLLAHGPIVTHWMPLPYAPQPTEDSNER